MIKLDILMIVLICSIILFVINEIVITVFKLKKRKLTKVPKQKTYNRNIPVSSSTSSSSYDDVDDYNNPWLFTNLKETFNTYTAEKVGTDYSGNDIYHDSSTGSYTTVNSFNEIEDQTYYRPSGSYNDENDYYNNINNYDYNNSNDSFYDTFYNNNDIYSNDDYYN